MLVVISRESLCWEFFSKNYLVSFRAVTQDTSNLWLSKFLKAKVTRYTQVSTFVVLLISISKKIGIPIIAHVGFPIKLLRNHKNIWQTKNSQFWLLTRFKKFWQLIDQLKGFSPNSRLHSALKFTQVLEWSLFFSWIPFFCVFNFSTLN